MSLVINTATLIDILKDTATGWSRNSDELRRLDSIAGDGDLGVTVELASKAMADYMANPNEEDIGKLLMRCGMQINIDAECDETLDGVVARGVEVDAVGFAEGGEHYERAKRVEVVVESHLAAREFHGESAVGGDVARTFAVRVHAPIEHFAIVGGDSGADVTERGPIEVIVVRVAGRGIRAFGFVVGAVLLRDFHQPRGDVARVIGIDEPAAADFQIRDRPGAEIPALHIDSLSTTHFAGEDAAAGHDVKTVNHAFGGGEVAGFLIGVGGVDEGRGVRADGLDGIVVNLFELRIDDRGFRVGVVTRGGEVVREVGHGWADVGDVGGRDVLRVPRGFQWRRARSRLR